MSGSEIDRHLGQKIAEARTRRGMDLDDLAREIDLAGDEIRRMESGAVRIASLQLARMARVLDLPLSWFFAGLPGQDVFDAPDARRSV